MRCRGLRDVCECCGKELARKSTDRLRHGSSARLCAPSAKPQARQLPRRRSVDFRRYDTAFVQRRKYRLRETHGIRCALRMNRGRRIVPSRSTCINNNGSHNQPNIHDTVSFFACKILPVATKQGQKPRVPAARRKDNDTIWREPNQDAR